MQVCTPMHVVERQTLNVLWHTFPPGRPLRKHGQDRTVIHTAVVTHILMLTVLAGKGTQKPGMCLDHTDDHGTVSSKWRQSELIWLP